MNIVKRLISLSKQLLPLTLFLCISITELSAQNVWTQKADYPGGNKSSLTGEAVDLNNDGITDKAYVGLGWDRTVSANDWWEYNPINNQWTAKDSLPADGRRGAVSFAIGDKVYVGLGISPIAGNPTLKDFWEYDATNDAWTQKASFPGSPRWFAAGFSAGGFGYVGAGDAGTTSNPNAQSDMYKYDPVNDSWTQLNNMPGNHGNAMGVATLDTDNNNIDDIAVFVAGRQNGQFLQEVWIYNIPNDSWTQKQDFPLTKRNGASCFTINNRAFIGGGQNDNTGLSDFYEYDLTNDSWLPVTNPPYTNGVVTPAAYTIGNKGYITAGADKSQAFDQHWEYTPPLSNDTANHIRGIVYFDADTNCVYDIINDTPLKRWIVKADPGPFLAITNSNGEYDLRVDSGTYSVSQIIPQRLNNLIDTICLSNGQSSYSVALGAIGIDSSGFDFANQGIDCPLLSVNIASDRRRRCFENLTVVEYCNDGFFAVDSVKVYVQLSDLVNLMSADYPFTIDSSGPEPVYVFEVGTVQPSYCGYIRIIDKVVCRTEEDLNLIQCSQAWITPINNCAPEDPRWNNASLDVSATCNEVGFALLYIVNNGNGDMTDSTDFNIYLDSLLAFEGKVLLPSGDSLVIQIPATGMTVRLEVDQVVGHPQNTTISTVVEGCGSAQGLIISTGFVNQFPVDNETIEKDVDCLPIIGSFDPNDKQVYPFGITAQHLVKPETPLTYLIRFQNTGNDTAFNVVVVDTLSTELDLSTLVLGPSSHEYDLTLSGVNGRSVLTFSFNDIMLPDSNVNLLGSQGFLKYTITPNNNVQLGTQIDNKADIFFDFNPPITTNNAFVTIANDQPENYDILDTVIFNPDLTSSVTALNGKSANVSIYPNPSKGDIMLTFTYVTGNQVNWNIYDLAGKRLYQSERKTYTSDIVFEKTSLSQLSPGMYVVEVWVDDERHVIRLVKN